MRPLVSLLGCFPELWIGFPRFTLVRLGLSGGPSGFLSLFRFPSACGVLWGGLWCRLPACGGVVVGGSGGAELAVCSVVFWFFCVVGLWVLLARRLFSAVWSSSRPVYLRLLAWPLCPFPAFLLCVFLPLLCDFAAFVLSSAFSVTFVPSGPFCSWHCFHSAAPLPFCASRVSPGLVLGLRLASWSPSCPVAFVSLFFAVLFCCVGRVFLGLGRPCPVRPLCSF